MQSSGAKVTGEGSDSNTESCIKINVKFGGRLIPISISPDATIKDLKSVLQPLTNVLTRGQKLIFRGKLLVDAMTLRSSEIGNGAKVMLMASQGLHQGDGPILKEARTSPIARRADNANKMPDEKMGVTLNKSRLERWKATRVIGLAECNLKVIPDEVWSCGVSAKVLDVSTNSIQVVPAQVSHLTSMQKLLLNANCISDESMSWEGLASMKHLIVLSLSHNQLTSVPAVLGALTTLRQLNVSNNKLTSLPTEIGLLTQLEVLKVNNNRISTIPASIGGCTSLVEVDLSSNLLPELPETFGNLLKLKALYLSNNGIKSLPSTLFKMCLHLSTLDLHNTELTIDLLRQYEGWQDFDDRRRTKHQKQLDFRVLGSAEFDEGADKN